MSMLTKRCCSTNTQFPSRMYGCESMMHSMASYVGTPKILDYAYTQGIPDNEIGKSHVHDMQTTDHNPISIEVYGLIVVSWNIEGMCTRSKRETAVKENIKYLQSLFDKPVIFLFQEIFLQDEVNDENAEDRMKRLLPGYTFITDGYTGCIAIPPVVKHSNVRYIERPDKKGKKCTVVTVTYKDKTFNLANIHLKSIVLYPITGKSLQRKEMQNILANTPDNTLYMGDFNTTSPEKLLGGKRTKRRRMKRK
uniref:Endonuclease/exonuclease/phosphatase domain-containing protein n=1 Tax=viral metagenome TaxID=1070528 RepID=A0A6C0AHI0_9ZZZZ